MGYLLLEGGAEFKGRMVEADRRALALAGEEDAAVDIIPAAAAPDNNHHHAGQSGIDWFRRIGARKVISRPVIDRDSADNLRIAGQLKHSRFVFLLGGFPDHLAESLRKTQSWRSICSVYQTGGVIGGSSAGAMVLCERFYDPFSDKVRAGLNLLPESCVIPHYNRVGPAWVKRLQYLLPEFRMLGLDEQTGLINDAKSGGRTIYVRGAVVLHGQEYRRSYEAGAIISREKLPSPQIDLLLKKW